MGRPKAAVKRIALLGCMREICRGAGAYARERPEWELVPLDNAHANRLWDPTRLTDTVGSAVAGVIGLACYHDLAQAYRGLNCPVVNVVEAPTLGLPYVSADNQAVAHAAVQHLSDRDLRHFAYVGIERHLDNAPRKQGFEHAVDECGGTGATLVLDDFPCWHQALREAMRDRLGDWLFELPRPVGVLAFCDHVGTIVIESARHAGLAVPHDVAVVGIDNEPPTCDVANPPLSSVDPDYCRVGYRAAAMLDRLLAGERSTDACEMIPPARVVQRGSTDTRADSDLERALIYIRRHAADGIGVDQLLEHLCVSRRTLEFKFDKHLNCSPADYIRRVQVERACHMLTQTDRSLTCVATACGFNSLSYFGKVFKRYTGDVPSTYRQKHHPKNGTANAVLADLAAS